MKKLAFEYWAPVVVWLGAMFLLSTDALSSQDTSEFFLPFLHFWFPSASHHQLDLMHHVIRKLAHVTNYSILTLLAYRTIRYEEAPTPAKVRTMAFVVVAALLDEFHQSFTSFRTPSLGDVGYDSLGALFVLSLINAYEAWRLRAHTVL